MFSAASEPSPARSDAPINLNDLGRVRVLRALTEQTWLSRAELVRRTGLARATVGSVIYDLIRAGLVRESMRPDPAGSGGAPAPGAALNGQPAGARTGRPPQLLSLAPEAGYALGLDVAHDHVRAILTDLAGTTRWDLTERLSVDHDPQGALNLAARLVERAVAETGVPRERLLGLGVGIACPVGKDGGRLHAEGIMPGWVGVRPADELAARTGLPVRIVNDANAGVLAERRFGAARDCADVIYVRLSSGIGAGVVCDGRMLLGHGGLAGELGHVTVEPQGAVCRCGNRGCLETVASPSAISGVLARSWGRPVPIDELADLLVRGERGATRVVEDAGDAVGRALAPAVMLLNPRLIVVGGELATAGDALFAPLRRALLRNTMTSHGQPLRIEASDLGDSAGVRGAAALVLDGVPERLGLAPAGGA